MYGLGRAGERDGGELLFVVLLDCGGKLGLHLGSVADEAFDVCGCCSVLCSKPGMRWVRSRYLP